MFGKTKRGLFILVIVILHAGILILAWQRSRLAWMSESAGIFSTAVIFGILLFIWVKTFLDLLGQTKNKHGEQLRGYWVTISHYFFQDKKGLLGGIILLIILYMALFAPFFAPYNPMDMDLVNTLAQPSWSHLLGTDNFGRDILSRLIYGSRIALGIGAGATLFNMILGGVLGLIGGYFGGAVDAVIMRLLETINSIPFIALVLLVISIFGSGPMMLILVLGIFGLQPARIIRSKVLSVRREAYVEASHATGASNFHIIFTHIFPNSMASLLVVTTMMIGANIITVAGLSFLGFGIRPPTPSWGAMLQQAQEYMGTSWWMAVFPGIMIFLAVFGFNVLGDALRDALDPRLH